jgi:hypothetical protein
MLALKHALINYKYRGTLSLTPVLQRIEAFQQKLKNSGEVLRRRSGNEYIAVTVSYGSRCRYCVKYDKTGKGHSSPRHNPIAADLPLPLAAVSATVPFKLFSDTASRNVTSALACAILYVTWQRVRSHVAYLIKCFCQTY